MSKAINVNPDHYKLAGRERPDTLAAERKSQRELRARDRWERRTIRKARASEMRKKSEG